MSAETRRGENSQFDVVVDGALVFSKQAQGRYPAADDIVA